MSQKPFPHKTIYENGVHRTYRVCTCECCGKQGHWKDTTRVGANFEVAAKGFRRMGWHVTSQGRTTCPRCLAEQALAASIKRAARTIQQHAPQAPAVTPEPIVIMEPELVLLEPDLVVLEQPVEIEPMTIAETPRQPTREDRRRIQDALDAHYLFDKMCYAKAFTDDVLAKNLNIPRAWVSEERDRAYGPEVNEAEAELERQLAELCEKATACAEKAQKASDAAMEAALEASEAGKRITDLLHKKAAYGARRAA